MDDNEGLVDTVSNLLGIVMLLAVLGIIAAGGQIVSQYRLSSPNPSNTPWHQLRAQNFPPLTSYYIANRAGVAALPVDRVVELVQASAEPRLAGVPWIEEDVILGEITLFDRLRDVALGLPTSLRDIDAYALRITLNDVDALHARWGLQGDANQQAEAVAEDALDGGRIPVFIVYEDGFAHFELFQDAFVGHGVRYRWVAVRQGGAIAIERSKDQFDDPAYRR